uniref:Uncharacterized protein n=1 Tax=Oryza rufipogon TaxID=4529 RepID=A0A0E0MSU7_ORYRU
MEIGALDLSIKESSILGDARCFYGSQVANHTMFDYDNLKNQYTFNVESGFTKTEIKHWVELFFGVKVVAVNSHRLSSACRSLEETLVRSIGLKATSLKRTEESNESQGPNIQVFLSFWLSRDSGPYVSA